MRIQIQSRNLEEASILGRTCIDEGMLESGSNYEVQRQIHRITAVVEPFIIHQPCEHILRVVVGNVLEHHGGPRL